MVNENKGLNFILEILFPKYNIHQLEYASMTRVKEYICSISAIMIDDLCIMMFLASIQYDNAFIWVWLIRTKFVWNNQLPIQLAQYKIRFTRFHYLPYKLLYALVVKWNKAFRCLLIRLYTSYLYCVNKNVVKICLHNQYYTIC